MTTSNTIYYGKRISLKDKEKEGARDLDVGGGADEEADGLGDEAVGDADGQDHQQAAPLGRLLRHEVHRHQIHHRKRHLPIHSFIHSFHPPSSTPGSAKRSSFVSLNRFLKGKS